MFNWRYGVSLPGVVGLVLYAGVVLAEPAVETTGSSALSAETSAILSLVPADDESKGFAQAQALLKRGPQAIMEVLAQLRPPKVGGDAQARFMVGSLTWFTGKPGNEKQRQVYVKTLIDGAQKAEDVEVKRFLLEQLAIAGKAEAVAPLTEYLENEQLSDSAVRAIVATKQPDVAKVLTAALPKLKGRARVSAAYALGDLRAKAAVPELEKLARSDNHNVASAALYALAHIGVESADALIADAISKTTSTVEPGRFASWRLVNARQLAKAGEREKAIELCRKIMNEAKAAQDEHIQIMALTALADISGKNAVTELVATTNDENYHVRKAALQYSVGMEGPEITRAWVKQLDNASTQSQAEIIDMLGQRKDRSALEAIRKALKSEHAEIRSEAITATARLGGETVLPDLVAHLSTTEKADIDAVRAELLQIDAKNWGAAVAAGLAKSSEPARVMLLDVLATRNAQDQKEAVYAQVNDESREVRVAAIKALGEIADQADLPRLLQLLLNAKAATERTAAQRVVASVAGRATDAAGAVRTLLEAYESATPKNKELLLPALAQLGGQQALDVVTRETSSTEPAVQLAAVRALSEATDQLAAPELLRILQESSDETHQVLAGRGYIRLIGASKAKGDEKVESLRAAMKLVKGADEKKQAIASLADIHTTSSLRLLSEFFGNPELKSEAAVSAAKAGMRFQGGRNGLDSPDALEILLAAYRLLPKGDLNKDLEKHLHRAGYDIETNQPKAGDDGFVQLFNGKDLSGWVGGVDGYKVEDGAIVSIEKKGGKLFTTKQYDDFDFRFEFKLTPGANNGLGIRSPLSGDPAFAGIELQILDDTHQKHKNLKPYQMHGSVYGVKPATQGHLKPAGEWNEQQVVARDGKITVTLNGTVILDTNVWDASTTETVDGAEHPGLHRRQGHISFLGHGDRVDFRNIRIRELINEVPEGYTALFNGKDLDGWKGLVGNPLRRAEMSPDQLAKAQQTADDEMRENWKVVNGILAFDGTGSHLCTTKDYGDFEMLVDWKIGPNGDSGVYLRGTPQVQIWDPVVWEIGSGGLYNNQKTTSSPLVMADHPIGEWNTFRIKMEGENVTVHLNDKLVVDNLPLENFWDRTKPLFPTGQIELQTHGSPVYFRNVFIKETKPAAQ